MDELWSRFEVEISELGNGIPEIWEKVNHMEIEYERLKEYIKTTKQKF